jgi:hypothetical protein
MNGAQSAAPSAAELDAVCALGFGSSLFTGSGDEANTFGCGTLISSSPPKIITARHVMPYDTPGYHTLPQDQSTTARVTRWRIKADGSATGASGDCIDYQQIHIIGYRVPSSGADFVLADLASAPLHITPYDIDVGDPAVSDDIVIAGWGVDGATLGAGSRPNDCTKITGRTIQSMVLRDAFGNYGSMGWSGTNPGANLYYSGGAILRDIGGGVLRATGVITGTGAGELAEQFRHDSSLEIDGLYEPAGVVEVPTTWVTPSFDTYLNQTNPTLDASGAGGDVNAISGKGADVWKSVIAFDVSSVSNVHSVALVVFATVGTAGTMRVRRIRRTGLTALANWNTYDGTNSWGTAGAENTSTDVFTANQFTYAFAGTHSDRRQYRINGTELSAMVAAAKADGGILRLLFESAAVDTFAGNLGYSEYLIPGERPRLEIIQTAVVSQMGAIQLRRKRKAMYDQRRRAS